jgi:hypothetical protein
MRSRITLTVLVEEGVISAAAEAGTRDAEFGLSKRLPESTVREFRRDWSAFNAIYTATKRSGDSEEVMVDRAILKFFDYADASACLNKITNVFIRHLTKILGGVNTGECRGRGSFIVEPCEP